MTFTFTGFLINGEIQTNQTVKTSEITQSKTQIPVDFTIADYILITKHFAGNLAMTSEQKLRFGISDDAETASRNLKFVKALILRQKIIENRPRNTEISSGEIPGFTEFETITEFSETTTEANEVYIGVFHATYYTGGATTKGAMGIVLTPNYSVASGYFPKGAVIRVEGRGLDGIYRVEDTGCASNVIDFYYHRGQVPFPFSRDGRYKDLQVWRIS